MDGDTQTVFNVLIKTATSGPRTEEFNPRNRSRPKGRLWFMRFVRDPVLLLSFGVLRGVLLLSLCSAAIVSIMFDS
jgi:hypothetical protein